METHRVCGADHHYSTDGSATALDDDGKEDTKGEDLGEPWDPNPPLHPPQVYVRGQLGADQTQG